MSDPRVEAAARALRPPDGLAAEFYRHCARGELRFQRCRDCGRWRHPPRILCPECNSSDWSWERSTGRGRVYSWTVTHQPLHPAYADVLPYAVLVVEMDEGVRVVAGLCDLEPSQLALDLPVEATLHPVSDDVGLVFFRP